MKREPELIKEGDKWKVTDGYVGNSFFRIRKQPSRETLQKLYSFFIKIINEES